MRLIELHVHEEANQLNALRYRAACTEKTKVLILNTPHNPVGKIFTRTELEKFAEIAKEKNILILADEVVRPRPSLLADAVTDAPVAFLTRSTTA